MTEKEKQFNQWFDEYADEVKVFEEADMKQAYLQGRAELEKENKVLAQNLEDTEIINKALEKENAELKGLVNQYKASKCSSISLVNRNMIMFDQLTKAKDILNNFLNACEDYEISEVRTEAEQFLNSEVEK